MCQAVRLIRRTLPGVGKRLAARLLDEFGSIDVLLLADEAQLINLRGISIKTARKLLSGMTSLSQAYESLSAQ